MNATGSAAARLRALAAQAAAAALVDEGRARGLFGVLEAAAPSTPAALAIACDVDAAWLRDWLDGLVLARLVDHDGVRDTYALVPGVAAAVVDLAACLDFARGDIDAHGAYDAALAAAARRQCPGLDDGGVLVLDLGDDPEHALSLARSRARAGAAVVAVDVDAAERVADNAEHPLGAALYRRSLARRGTGRGGRCGRERLLAAALGAGLGDVRVIRVDVGGVPFVLVAGIA